MRNNLLFLIQLIQYLAIMLPINGVYIFIIYFRFTIMPKKVYIKIII